MVVINDGHRVGHVAAFETRHQKAGLTLIGIGALIVKVIICLVPLGFVVLGVFGYRQKRKSIWLVAALAALIVFLFVGNNFLTYAREHSFLSNLSPQNVDIIFIDTRTISDPFEVAQVVAALNDVQWSDHKSSDTTPISMSIKMQSGETHQYRVIPYLGGPGAVIRSDGGEAFSENLLTIFEQSRLKQEQQQQSQQAAMAKQYDGVGVVKAIDPRLTSVEIDHEEIKDLMPAMTMQFWVKDRVALMGIAPGDRVAFTLENGVGGLKIIVIRKL